MRRYETYIEIEPANSYEARKLLHQNGFRIVLFNGMIQRRMIYNEDYSGNTPSFPVPEHRGVFFDCWREGTEDFTQSEAYEELKTYSCVIKCKTEWS